MLQQRGVKYSQQRMCAGGRTGVSTEHERMALVSMNVWHKGAAFCGCKLPGTTRGVCSCVLVGCFLRGLQAGQRPCSRTQGGLLCMSRKAGHGPTTLHYQRHHSRSLNVSAAKAKVIVRSSHGRPSKLPDQNRRRQMAAETTPRHVACLDMPRQSCCTARLPLRASRPGPATATSGMRSWRRCGSSPGAPAQARPDGHMWRSGRGSAGPAAPG